MCSSATGSSPYPLRSYSNTSFVAGLVNTNLASPSYNHDGLNVIGKLPVALRLTKKSLYGQVNNPFESDNYTLIVQSLSVWFTIGISYTTDCLAGTLNSNIALTILGKAIADSLYLLISNLFFNVNMTLKSLVAFLNAYKIGNLQSMFSVPGFLGCLFKSVIYKVGGRFKYCVGG